MSTARQPLPFSAQVYQPCFKMPLAFVGELESAGLHLVYIECSEDLDFAAPVILIYGEPASLFNTEWASKFVDESCLLSPYGQLLNVYERQSPQSAHRVFLVNVDFDLPAGVVYSYFNGDLSRCNEVLSSGSGIDTSVEVVDSLLALEVIRFLPSTLSEYQRLEEYSSASLGLRQPDLGCVERYREGSSLSRLWKARQEIVLLGDDLTDLMRRYEILESDDQLSLCLRERFRKLQAIADQAHASEVALDDLRLSCDLNSRDQEDLSRRTALLAGLVGEAAASSLSLQSILAKLLAC